jgi:hypothetical protein
MLSSQSAITHHVSAIVKHVNQGNNTTADWRDKLKNTSRTTVRRFERRPFVGKFVKFCCILQGPVVQKPINANLGLNLLNLALNFNPRLLCVVQS